MLNATVGINGLSDIICLPLKTHRRMKFAAAWWETLSSSATRSAQEAFWLHAAFLWQALRFFLLYSAFLLQNLCFLGLFSFSIANFRLFLALFSFFILKCTFYFHELICTIARNLYVSEMFHLIFCQFHSTFDRDSFNYSNLIYNYA